MVLSINKTIHFSKGKPRQRRGFLVGIGRIKKLPTFIGENLFMLISNVEIQAYIVFVCPIDKVSYRLSREGKAHIVDAFINEF